MKGNFILTSNGYLDGDRYKELEQLIKTLSKDKKVLVIDNATLTGSNADGVENVVNNFKKITLKVDIVTLNEDNLEIMFDYDIIYFCGGDLLPLIEIANNSNIKDIILQYYSNGGTIIGESSGSIFFGSDCKWYYDIQKGTKPKYDVTLPTYKGLGISQFNIFPHWNKRSEDIKSKTDKYEKDNNIIITRLKDGEWIYVDPTK